MAITINNTTINSRLTIIYDSAENLLNTNDGPKFGTGNTESDVIIDGKSYLNIRSHTEVPEDVHALQCWNRSGTWSYTLEYTDNRPNETLSEIPSWVNNVVIRCEAQDAWENAYNANLDAQSTAWVDAGNSAETFDLNDDQARAAADPVRVSYLANNSITY